MTENSKRYVCVYCGRGGHKKDIVLHIKILHNVQEVREVQRVEVYYYA